MKEIMTREEALKEIKENQSGIVLQKVIKYFDNDSEIIIEAIKKNVRYLYYVNSEWQKENKDILLELIKGKISLFMYLCEDLLKDKDYIKEIIKDKKNLEILKDIHISLREDKAFWLELVKENGNVLRYLERYEKIKKDKDIALEAIKQNVDSFEYIHPSLREDNVFVRELMKVNPKVFYKLAYSLKNDKEVMLEALKENGNALDFASIELRNDKDIVLEAIKQNVFTLENDNKEEKELNNINFDIDTEIILEATKFNSKSLSYINNDKDIVLEAIKQNIFPLENDNKEESKISMNGLLNSFHYDFHHSDKRREMFKGFMNHKDLKYKNVDKSNLKNIEYLYTGYINTYIKNDNAIPKAIKIREDFIVEDWINDIFKELEGEELRDFMLYNIKYGRIINYNVLPQTLKDDKEIKSKILEKVGKNKTIYGKELSIVLNILSDIDTNELIRLLKINPYIFKLLTKENGYVGYDSNGIECDLMYDKEFIKKIAKSGNVNIELFINKEELKKDKEFWLEIINLDLEHAKMV